MRSFQVEDYLGYWLFYAQRSVAYAFSEILEACCLKYRKPYVITPAQWGVLSVLYENDGQTIGKISQRRGLDAPTITGIVTRLEQNGLVERRHNHEDRRIVKVYLTNEAQDFEPFLMEEVIAYNGVITRGFSEAEQRDLIANLQQVVANISPDTGDRFGLLPRQILYRWEANLSGNSTETGVSTEKEGAL